MPGANRKYKKLIKDCIKGREKAQKKLYDLFSPKMLSLCYRYAKNKIDAEDIFQSGWLKIFENIDQLRNTNLLESWMKKIFVNEALQFYKRTERISFSDNYFNVENENDNFKRIYLKFQVDEITELIQKLPNRMRMVFNLYIIEEFSHTEIAEMMNISLGTSKSQLHDARKILRKQITRLNTQKLTKFWSI